ncbi:glycosyl transferase family 1 [Jejuia pallidilutea]|uniref:TPR/glycosyl transferase domain protein n=1 Tax=Jejuia pallidilutea TaxID=504487 RepID=A0A090VQQ2_9FLAO|nr:glycosyl transferase family 1 [Jejuia pallidilutea]GAL67016.1 TPR/glycosyl transferase domain protein [Jejuia pallidilutea]GAL90595.1 TPR/glycosyl transferase domain protein [Jejuia pallidilutea]
MRKKVLILTYYWPPAGGPGVQRWLKFVKYLPEFNIQPIVFVPENANYPIIDKTLSVEVSKDLELVKLPITEPYTFARFFSKGKTNTISRGIINENKKQSLIEKLLLFIRGNFFIPDARVGWVKPATSFLLDYIKNNNIETIITTGPPHSIHLIGLNLKQKLGLKWLADFRDPWTTIGYHKQLKLTKTSQQKHKALEKQVLTKANQIIVTSSVTKQEFQQITHKPIAVITNGYDNETSQVVTMDSKFSLAHIGSFLAKRNPEILWKALSELIKENDDFKTDFQLNLVGFVSENILESIKKYNLINYVNKVGYISHLESIKFQKKSQALLLIEIDSEDTRCIIPGKLFEYMVSNRPIIAIGPKASDVEQIIKNTNTGKFFGYHDFESLKKTILDHYKAYQQGHLKTSPIGLQKYHRKSLTHSLSNLL